jgi:hypothetical protein
VHSGKVALLSGMLVVGLVVAVHSTSSSAMLVAVFVHWVSRFGTAAIAHEIKGATIALASTVGSSTVA